LLGLVPWEPYLPIPYALQSNLFGPEALSKLLLPVLGGSVLAILLSPWPHSLASSTTWTALMRVVGPFRRAGLCFGDLVKKGNNVLCQWLAASICLLMLAFLLGALMLVAT
jgi:hypothetical protein